MPLAEVLMAAGDVVSCILTAKGAAQAAQAAAEAAKQAWASAEKVSLLSYRGGSTFSSTISMVCRTSVAFFQSQHCWQ